MKSSIKKTTFKAIYRLLDKVSPINGDCGRLCGSICCTYDEKACGTTGEKNGENDTAMGIYLLPGEEKLFTRREDWLEWSSDMAEDYEFPESWHGRVWFIRCKTPPFCRRELRPMQCRVFPLAPHIDTDGTLRMIYQSGHLPYSCPLIAERVTLNDDFLKANHTVWKHLIRDPLIYDLVLMDSEYRREDGEDITVLYPTV